MFALNCGMKSQFELGLTSGIRIDPSLLARTGAGGASIYYVRNIFRIFSSPPSFVVHATFFTKLQHYGYSPSPSVRK